MPNMFKFICDIPTAIKRRGLEDNGKVQQFIDSECLRLCESKVPKRENILIECYISERCIKCDKCPFMVIPEWKSRGCGICFFQCL